MSVETTSTMMNITRPLGDADAQAMPPPPPKRFKATEGNDERRFISADNDSAVPVSAERDASTTLIGTMNRKRYNTASPTESLLQTSLNKKFKLHHPVPTKQNHDLSPTTSKTNDDYSAGSNSKMDPHIFASAYALASLALSPEHNPSVVAAPGSRHSPTQLQAREDDQGRIMDGDFVSLRQPSSPNVSEAAVPISPEDAAYRAHKKRVQFANRIKSTRSIPSRVPGQHTTRGKGHASRMIQLRRGSPLYSSMPPPPPSSYGQHHVPHWHHHSGHHHHHQHRHPHAPPSPCPWPPHAAPTPHPMQLPTLAPPQHHQQQLQLSLGPAAPPPASTSGAMEWICDFCHVASFATYEEACSHEGTCRVRQNGPRDRKIPMQAHPPPPPFIMPDGMDANSNNVVWHEGRQHELHDNVAEAEDPNRWCTGRIALAVPFADAEWLSELNCFVREYCVEAFSATSDDVACASKRGRITLNQVGIRCRFCVHRDSREKQGAAVSYPTTVTGIYESVKRWQRVHQSTCLDVPLDIRRRLAELTAKSIWVPTTRQYWADSARALGMTDTHDGIRFERPPSVPEGWMPDNHPAPSTLASGQDASSDDGYVALPQDEETVPEYVYFLMRQVEKCKFTEVDRFVARSKGPVGFAGFQCRHCSGHAGLGKYFPLTPKSLSTNSTSQNIHAHLLKCRKVDPQIKECLVRLKTERGRSFAFVPGWRREFFDRVWERLHGEGSLKKST